MFSHFHLNSTAYPGWIAYSVFMNTYDSSHLHDWISHPQPFRRRIFGEIVAREWIRRRKCDRINHVVWIHFESIDELLSSVWVKIGFNGRLIILSYSRSFILDIYLLNIESGNTISSESFMMFEFSSNLWTNYSGMSKLWISWTNKPSLEIHVRQWINHVT